MNNLILARTLLYRGEDGQLTRYEIFRTEEDQANNIDSIHVYREKSIEGQQVWFRTDDVISLDHLGFPKDGGVQRIISTDMRACRDLGSAIGECNKHWSKKYA